MLNKILFFIIFSIRIVAFIVAGLAGITIVMMQNTG
jgi:hypothetical protein